MQLLLFTLQMWLPLYGNTLVPCKTVPQQFRVGKKGARKVMEATKTVTGLQTVFHKEIPSRLAQ